MRIVALPGSPVAPAIRVDSTAVRVIVDTYRRAFSGLPRTVWVLALTALVNRAGGMVLPFMTLYLTERLGYPATLAGRIVAVWGIGSVVGSLLGGFLVDRLGALRVQHIALLANALGFALLPWVVRPGELGVLVLLTAVLGEALRPALMSAVSIAAPREVRARSLALLRLANNLGFAVGPAVGGVLASFSYTWLFVVDGGTCAAAAVLLGGVLGWRRGIVDRREAGAVPVPGPWVRPAFVAFLLTTFALGLVFFQVFSTLTLYWRNVYSLPEKEIGMLLGINGVMIATLEMVLVHLVERWPALRVAAVGSVLIGLGFALTPLGRGGTWAALTVVVWTLGEMLTLPQVNVIVASQGLPEQRGSYMGAYSLAFSAAFVVAPAVGTTVLQHFGGDVLWLAVGALGPVVASAFLALSPRLAVRHGAPGPPPSPEAAQEHAHAPLGEP